MVFLHVFLNAQTFLNAHRNQCIVISSFDKASKSIRKILKKSVESVYFEKEEVLNQVNRRSLRNRKYKKQTAERKFKRRSIIKNVLLKDKLPKQFQIVKQILKNRKRFKYLDRRIRRQRRWEINNKLIPADGHIKAKKKRNKARLELVKGKGKVSIRKFKLKLRKLLKRKTILRQFQTLPKDTSKVSTLEKSKKEKVKLAEINQFIVKKYKIKKVINLLRNKLNYFRKLQGIYINSDRAKSIVNILTNRLIKFKLSYKYLPVCWDLAKPEIKRNLLIRRINVITKLKRKRIKSKQQCKVVSKVKMSREEFRKKFPSLAREKKKKKKKKKKYKKNKKNKKNKTPVINKETYVRKISKRAKKHYRKLRRIKLLRLKRRLNGHRFMKFIAEYNNKIKYFHAKAIKKYAIYKTKKILSKVKKLRKACNFKSNKTKPHLYKKAI